MRMRILESPDKKKAIVQQRFYFFWWTINEFVHDGYYCTDPRNCAEAIVAQAFAQKQYRSPEMNVVAEYHVKRGGIVV